MNYIDDAKTLINNGADMYRTGWNERLGDPAYVQLVGLNVHYFNSDDEDLGEYIFTNQDRDASDWAQRTADNFNE